MKIIVCGAGEVGANIAKQLVYEDNDVTIIDDSESRLRSLNKTLDLKSICGKIILPEILEKAGANEADIIIAVSEKDESNILCCQLANFIFNIPIKVARIKESGFLNPKYYDNLFVKNIITNNLGLLKCLFLARFSKRSWLKAVIADLDFISCQGSFFHLYWLVYE